MLNIKIDCQKTVVENPDYRIDDTLYPIKWTLKTDNFFGDVCATFQRNFPDFDCGQLGNVIAADVISRLHGSHRDDTVKIFGCRELGQSYYDLIAYIDGRQTIVPTLKEIEKMRIAHRMAVNYLPVSFNDEDGMRFEGLTSVTQVMIAALYYYAFNDYKLVRCKHCGKWFATKSLKTQYCNRISPCFGTIITGKESLQCEAAVRNIMQKCGRIKNRIETKAATSIRGDNSYLYHFATECDPYYIDAKTEPTVENLEKYYGFLKDTERKREWLIKGGNFHG